MKSVIITKTFCYTSYMSAILAMLYIIIFCLLCEIYE